MKVNSRKLYWIRSGIAYKIVNSEWNREKDSFREFIFNSLSIARIHYFFPTPLQIHYFSRFHFDSLSFSRIHYPFRECTIISANLLSFSWIHYPFREFTFNSLWFHYFLRDCTSNSLFFAPNHFEFTIFNAISLRIHDLFREFRFNSLSFLRVH